MNEIQWIFYRHDGNRSWCHKFTYEQLNQLQEYIKLYPNCEVYEVRWKCDNEAILDYGTI